MQRERGKVITQTNKEMIAEGSAKIKPKKDWKGVIKETEAKRQEGKPVTHLTEKISHKRATTDKNGGNERKPVINKPIEKPKSHDKSTPDR
jgi:hypothetical protein